MNISKRCVGGSHCVNEARRRVSFTEDFQEKKIFSISKEFHISRTQPHVEMIRDLIARTFSFSFSPFILSTIPPLHLAGVFNQLQFYKA